MIYLDLFLAIAALTVKLGGSERWIRMENQRSNSRCTPTYTSLHDGCQEGRERGRDEKSESFHHRVKAS